MVYRDLLVWQKSICLVEDVYVVCRTFPAFERFGLGRQMQRAAVSVPSNIAEGHGRKATRVYINHLHISFGSLMELETQLIIASRLKYIKESQVKEFLAQTNEIGKMISGLIKSLKTLNPQSIILNPKRSSYAIKK